MSTYSKKDELPPWPLTATDVLQLAKFIENTLLHFKQCHSSYEQNYLAELRILCHCYYLVMVELGEHHCYCAAVLKRFQVFPLRTEAIRTFSFCIAEMINTLGDKSRLIDRPWFYPHFVEAVTHILSDRAGYLVNDLELTQYLLSKIIPH